MTRNKNSCESGIVLFAKKRGLTSFKSLFTIKHGLNTTKVGHTGTLDSFAQGLLVVCVGSLTRLASLITAFDKEYQGIIKFGEETDTLEPSGQIIKTAELPSLSSLEESLKKFLGEILQAPPSFSAIKINGKRSSDLQRQGKSVEIPKRPVIVYKIELLDTITEIINNEEKVKYAKILFHVSKGTYIRSLARDIAYECNSCGHLIGLLRTKVGSFKLEDAVGFNDLQSFTIENVLQDIENQDNVIINEDNYKSEIVNKLKPMTYELSKECGFFPIKIKDSAVKDFFNGKTLRFDMFESFDKNKEQDICKYSVFADSFIGVINKNQDNKLSYDFVVNRKKEAAE